MEDAAAGPGRPPLRVLLVDDHEVVLEGLRSMLSSQRHRVEIVGATTDPVEAVRLGVELCPDLVLLDVRLKATSGLDLCQELTAVLPGTKVVFFTVYDDEQYLYQGLRMGAAGFLLKRTTAPELVAHLERAKEGELVIDPALAGRVALTAAHLQRGEFWPGAHVGLTQRESDVLGLIVQGLSMRAVALRLSISEETVKSHARAVYRKLGASDRAQAVTAALREGIFH